METNSSCPAVDIIRQAWKTGRPVVPFLAAGFSASSGFPLTTDLTTYLLQVKFFIKYGVYRHTLGQDFTAIRSIGYDEPEYRSSKYIADFGWPNPNQLLIDLDHFTASKSFQLMPPDAKRKLEGTYAAQMGEIDKLRSRTESELVKQLKAEVRRVVAQNAHLKSQLNLAPDGDSMALSHAVPTLRNEQAWIDWISTETLPHVSRDELAVASYLLDTESANSANGYWWGTGRWRVSTVAAHMALEDLRLRDDNDANSVQKAVRQGEFDLRSDWSRLLMELTEGNFGLVDALFTQLSLRYNPSLSHILLAHLTRLIGIRLILTTNFDPYIERAMAQEGLDARVLTVGRHDPPPDPSVIKQALSIVKLHGGSHSVRVGEPLDHALDDATRTLIDRSVPSDALLVVIGFSGYERRMMQLIEHLTLSSARSESDNALDHTKVLWMHWESDDRLPPTVRQFEAKINSPVNTTHLTRSITSNDRFSRARFRKARLSDSGEFLLDTYQQLTTTLPKSNAPYSVLRKRLSTARPRHPVDASDLPEQDAATKTSTKWTSFHLFVRDSLLTSEPCRTFTIRDVNAPSLRMSEFVQQKSGYQLIWIDLEDHHTVSGVVTDIIDKMRVFDPDLPPLILPVEAETVEEPGIRDIFDKSTRFIHRALRRGRYVVAFDALEGFGRLHTSHHGVPGRNDATAETSESPARRVEELLLFIRKLIEIEYRRGDESGAENGRGSSRMHTPPIADCDWYCCIAIDEPMPRHWPPEDSADGVLNQIRSQIVSFVAISDWKSPANVKSDKYCRWELKSTPRIACAEGGDLREWLLGMSEVPEPQIDYEVLQTEPVDSPLQSTTKAQSASQMLCKSLRAALFGSSPDLEVKSSEAKKAQARKKLEISGNGRRHVAELRDSHRSRDDTMCFLISAIFRRPRSRTALLTVIGTFVWPECENGGTSFRGKRENFDACADRLETRGLLCVMDGGFYRIPHHLHEWTYKWLTLDIRTRDFRTQKWSDLEPNFEDRVTRLVFLTLCHSRIAKFYYLHVFQRTQDVNGLFEYLYHRTSAMRYAKLLHVFLGQKQGKLSDIVCDLIRVLWDFEEEASLGSDAKEPEQRVLALRLKFVHSLLDVLHRQQDTILSSASADTWLAWVKQISKDLSSMVCLAESSDEAKEQLTAVFGTISLTDQEFAEAWLEKRIPPQNPRIELNVVQIELIHAAYDLRWMLQDLHGRLLREKREWMECIGQRAQLAARLMLGLFSKLIKRFPKAALPRRTKATRDERATLEESPAVNHWKRLSDELTTALATAELADCMPARHGGSHSDSGNEIANLWRAIVKVSENLMAPSGQRTSNRAGTSDFRQIVEVLANDASAGNHLRLLFDCNMDAIACGRHRDKSDEHALAEAEKRFALLRRDLVDPGQRAASALIANGVDGRGIYARFVGMEFDIEFEHYRYMIENKTRLTSDEQILERRPWGCGCCYIQGRPGPLIRKADATFREWLVKLETIRQKVRVAPKVADTDLARRMCQYDQLQAECLLWLARYEEVHRVLDRSTSLLDSTDPQHRFLLSIVNWIRAFTHMQSADADLLAQNAHPRSEGGDGNATSHATEVPGPQIASAHAKLLAAEGSLAEMERMLRNGRRNIGQWRRLYNGKAQVQIEHLLLLLVSPNIKANRLHFVATVHSHLSKGLEAIRGGWDCSLNPCPTDDWSRQDQDRRDWAVQWLQLMTTGYLVLWLYAELRPSLRDGDNWQAHVEHGSSDVTNTSEAHFRSQTPSRVAALYLRLEEERELTQLPAFIKRWQALNLSAGLDRFIGTSPSVVWMDVLQQAAQRAKNAIFSGQDSLRTRGLHDPCWLRQLVLIEAQSWLRKPDLEAANDPAIRATSVISKLLRAIQTPEFAGTAV